MQAGYHPSALRYAPPVGRRGVGSVRTHPRRWEAYAALAGGIGTVVYLLLSFHGYRHTATAIGLFGGVSAATLAAIKIFSQPEHRAEPPVG